MNFRRFYAGRFGLTFLILVAIQTFMLSVLIPANYGAGLITVNVDGSTTVFPIVSQAAECYMDNNTDVMIIVSGTGSGTGIRSLISGSADIAMASREMKEDEKEQLPDWYETVIAKDGIAIIVNSWNSLEKLTLEQLWGIYNGTYSDWAELGGPEGQIVVINRESTSGTREFFWEHVMQKGDFREDKQISEKNSNGAIQAEVSNTPTAIGYVGLGYITGDNIKVLAIKNEGGNYIFPGQESIKNGSYPIARNLYLYTKGAPGGVIKDFIDFILSPVGQSIVELEDFIPIAPTAGLTEIPVEEPRIIDGYMPGFMFISIIYVITFIYNTLERKKKEVIRIE